MEGESILYVLSDVDVATSTGSACTVGFAPRVQLGLAVNAGQPNEAVDGNLAKKER
jgi:cysteine sulfinate desulfinase/cysteine desulfurase-like protein